MVKQGVTGQHLSLRTMGDMKDKLNQATVFWQNKLKANVAILETI